MLDQRLATRVENFVSRLKRESVCMHGFILDVRGEVKATAYYPPFVEGKAHRMYSVSKSMTALAIGLLLDEGKISLDDRIADYFRDILPEKPDARLMRLKIRDMLRMATCYRATVYRETDDDWTKPFFTAASTHEPGTVFHYDTGCSQVLAALVARLTGQQVMDYLNERVFTPLGADDEKHWLRDPAGTCQGGTGLCMSLRDLHKVTRLVMDGGRGILPGDDEKAHRQLPVRERGRALWLRLAGVDDARGLGDVRLGRAACRGVSGEGRLPVHDCRHAP